MPLERSSDGSCHLPKVTQVPGEQGQTRERQWQWPIHWAWPGWKSQTYGCVCGKPGVWWLTDPWAFLAIWFPRTGQSDRFAAKLKKLTECVDMWNREDAARDAQTTSWRCIKLCIWNQTGWAEVGWLKRFSSTTRKQFWMLLAQQNFMFKDAWVIW